MRHQEVPRDAFPTQIHSPQHPRRRRRTLGKRIIRFPTHRSLPDLGIETSRQGAPLGGTTSAANLQWICWPQRTRRFQKVRAGLGKVLGDGADGFCAGYETAGLLVDRAKVVDPSQGYSRLVNLSLGLKLLSISESPFR